MSEKPEKTRSKSAFAKARLQDAVAAQDAFAKARLQDAVAAQEKRLTEPWYASYIPNDYEEYRKLVDPRPEELANSMKLEVLGCAVTVMCVPLCFIRFPFFSTRVGYTGNAYFQCPRSRRRYACTLIVMLCLAVYYSIYETQVVGTFNPKGNIAAYRAQMAAYPSTKCDCEEHNIPFNRFAVPNVTVNGACTWVKADLASNISSCRNLQLTGYCNAVRDACLQSQSTIDWIVEEFNNSAVSSAALIQETPLNTSTHASFLGDFKIGELIATGPKKTVSAWASANMPKMMKMLGDLIIRAKVLTKKVNEGNTASGTGPFNTACKLAVPVICEGDDSTLKMTTHSEMVAAYPSTAREPPWLPHVTSAKWLTESVTKNACPQSVFLTVATVRAKKLESHIHLNSDNLSRSWTL